MPWVGPCREAGHHVELAEETSHDLIGLGFGAQTVELSHHSRQGHFDVTNRPLRVELALRIQATLTFHELFAVEV